MRTLKITPEFTSFAAGSVVIETGKTKILCTAMVEESVPKFLYDSGSGWVTAEYDMLPSSTPSRNKRSARRGQVKGRTSEIQRLVGRALRSCIDLKELGQRTVYIDCDVLQADGGTRTASVNGGFSALLLACRSLVKNNILKSNPITKCIGAVSVGIVNGCTIVDLDYEHDSSAEVDMNVIMDEKGRLIEIQGTAEKEPFSRAALNTMVSEAWKSIDNIIKYQKKILKIK